VEAAPQQAGAGKQRLRRAVAVEQQEAETTRKAVEAVQEGAVSVMQEIARQEQRPLLKGEKQGR
jgi:hypothetical protein